MLQVEGQAYWGQDNDDEDGDDNDDDDDDDDDDNGDDDNDDDDDDENGDDDDDDDDDDGVCLLGQCREEAGRLAVAAADMGIVNCLQATWIVVTVELCSDV